MKKYGLCFVCALLCLCLLAGGALANSERDWALSCRFKTLRATDIYTLQDSVLQKIDAVPANTYCQIAPQSGIWVDPATGVAYDRIVYQQNGSQRIGYVRRTDIGLCVIMRADSNGMSGEVHELLYDENATGTWTYYVKNDGAKLYLSADQNSAVISTHAKDTRVTVIATDSTWAAVRVNGQTGRMRMSDLTQTKPKQESASAASERTVLYVSVGEGGTLALRRDASGSAIQEGVYANGSQVTVLSRYNGWARVLAPDGKEGYMLLSHLSAAPSAAASGAADSETAGGQTRYIVSADGKPVPLYDSTMLWEGAQKGQCAPGTRVTAYPVEGEWSTWCYVQTPAGAGYVLSKYLSASVPQASAQADAVSQDVTPLYAMQVQTGNSGRLHLRAEMSTQSKSLGLYGNNTNVLVIGDYGEWVRVIVGDQRHQGYMQKKYLAPTDTDYGRIVEDFTQTNSAALPDVVMYVHTGNSGRLHLRTRPSTSAKSLGLYENGTQVTVVVLPGENCGKFLHVTVDGKEGYMLGSCLSDSAPQPPAAAAPEAQAAQPEPAAPSASATLYVHTGNAGRLHLRARGTSNSDSLGLFDNGTPVTVLSTQGTWAHVRVNGQEGYMKLKFLSESAGQ